MQNIILPKFIGHRGACGIAPENTMSSMLKAKTLGLNFVEVDVKITKDKVPVLLQDETLDRTTNGSGLCCDFTFNELQKLDAGIWFNENYKNEKILSLDKCIDFVSNNQMGINIELKPNLGKEKENVISVKKILETKKNINKYFISSFDKLSLKYASEILSGIPRGYLINNNHTSLSEIVKICNKYNCFSIGLNIDYLNSEIVKFFKKNNLVVTIFSVNEINIAKNIFSWGADSVFTDRPDIVYF